MSVDTFHKFLFSAHSAADMLDSCSAASFGEIEL